MRAVTWIKIIVTVLIATFLVIFFVQNTEPVEIQFAFGRPYRFGLIYLLSVSFILGAAAALVVMVMVHKKVKRKKMLAESDELLSEE